MFLRDRGLLGCTRHALGAGSAAQGQGVRAGVAYKLEDGNIVYIPETGAAPASASVGGAGGAATPAPAKR